MCLVSSDNNSDTDSAVFGLNIRCVASVTVVLTCRRVKYTFTWMKSLPLKPNTDSVYHDGVNFLNIAYFVRLKGGN